MDRMSFINSMVAGLFALIFSTPASHAETAADSRLVPNPEEGGPRRFEVATEELLIRAAPESNSAILARLRKGDIVKNLGCFEESALHWCAVKPMRASKKGYATATDLIPARGPDGVIAVGRDESKRRAKRKDFDRKAIILCAQEQGQTLSNCQAGVARAGGGDATVAATFPNGFVRFLYFEHGEFMRGSSTMSGVGTDTDWKLKAGVFVIRVDDQQFEISSEFVLGVE